VVAAVAQWGLHQAAMLSAAMATSSGRLSGAILIVAGAYQLTSWKSRCLTHCRSPLGFLMTNWRDGTIGAFRMGFRHGAYCLGCCWALMCVLFVVGVMNLIWVAALTGFVLIEKIGPAGAIVARVAGAAMVVIGIVAIAR
jgi:predicted metal-binding membrane protein